ncbi:MAG: hypothetical protein KC656_01970 [Myxococcales bacterium]|nr:hypothetical protein [Myxococcales bacterium]MCB9691543.1 hypothetical protein [Alphaproteobacteria bacterium]
MSDRLSWLDSRARWALAVLLLSSCLSWRVTQTVDGRVVSDLDFLGGPLGLVAVVLSGLAVHDADGRDDVDRGRRLAVAYGLLAVSLLRTWVAVGFWPL